MSTNLNKEVTKQPTEIELLKTQADILGLEYKGNISAKALRKQIMDTLNAADDSEGMSDNDRATAEKDSIKLIRCIVMPNAAHMRDYQGQLFSVGNSLINAVSKYVLFNVEYHVPKIILDHIQQQEMQFFVTRKVNGREIRESKMTRAYSVTILDPLTDEELKELARSQENRNAVEG